MTHQREIRAGVPVEVREVDGGGVTVVGYAAVFDQETDIGGMFREVIRPGAFRDAIGRDDVVFLVNHDGLPLARTRSGTLALTEDSTGLRMQATLDMSDPDVQQILPKMRRGDLDKMSFAFVPEVQTWDESGATPLRIIQRASLYDVSIVTTPAYDGTSIALRALEQHRRAANYNAAQQRLRMKARFHLGLNGQENG